MRASGRGRGGRNGSLARLRHAANRSAPAPQLAAKLVRPPVPVQPRERRNGAVTFSHSSLSSFETCPKKYQFRYVRAARVDRRASRPSWASASTRCSSGSTSSSPRHGALARARALALPRQLGGAVRRRRAAHRARGRRSRADYRPAGERCLENAYRRLYPFDDETLGLEHAVQFPLDADGRYARARRDRPAGARARTARSRSTTTRPAAACPRRTSSTATASSRSTRSACAARSARRARCGSSGTTWSRPGAHLDAHARAARRAARGDRAATIDRIRARERRGSRARARSAAGASTARSAPPSAARGAGAAEAARARRRARRGRARQLALWYLAPWPSASSASPPARQLHLPARLRGRRARRRWSTRRRPSRW